MGEIIVSCDSLESCARQLDEIGRSLNLAKNELNSVQNSASGVASIRIAGARVVGRIRKQQQLLADRIEAFTSLSVVLKRMVAIYEKREQFLADSLANLLNEDTRLRLPLGNEELLFAGYDFSTKYLQDIDFGTAMGYSIKNWKETLFSLVTARVRNLSIEDAYMRQSSRTKPLIKEAIDRMIGRYKERNSTFDAFTKEKKAFDALKKMLAGEKATESSAKKILDFLKNGKVGKDYLNKFAEHYAALESLRETFPSDSLMHQHMQELMEDYATASARELIKGEISDALGNLGDPLVDTAIQGTLGANERISSMDKVIGLSIIKHDAYDALAQCGESLRQNGYDAGKVEQYDQLFSMCKELTIMEYDTMKAQYAPNSKEFAYLNQEIAKLQQMTPQNHIRATPYGRQGGGFGGGGSGGGRF